MKPHRPYLWAFVASLCFTLALVGFARRGQTSRERLADVASRVSFDSCQASNQQADVLLRALNGNLSTLKAKYTRGAVTTDEFREAYRALSLSIVQAEASKADCAKRAARIRSAAE